MNRADRRRQKSGQKFGQKSGRKTSQPPQTVLSENQRLNIQLNLKLAAQYYREKRPAEAANLCDQVLKIAPNHPIAMHLYGVLHSEAGRDAIAAKLLEKSISIVPDHAETHFNYAFTLDRLGRKDEAIDSYKKAIALNLGYAQAHNNLGNALKEQGNVEDAAENYQAALAIDPNYTIAHSNTLLLEHYRFGHTAKTLYELHRKWDEHHGSAFRSAWPEHKNNRETDRRLRIGFMSADLGRHPVGFFVVRLFENIPKQDIEIFVYSDRKDDELTPKIKANVDIWRSICGIGDSQVFEMVLQDEIDILFDLAGHSADNRLLVFARKPAPIQITWAGYVGTTGLSAIDYILSDSLSTFENEEKYYSERVLRMPKGYLCYDPPEYAPDVGEAPFQKNGYVTFGSFNNTAKINRDVVSTWAKILHETPGSRLLLKYNQMDSMQNTKRLTAWFEAEGIDPSRLKLEGMSPHLELLERYNSVDIALDTFPYSGGLTTFEALWMGVPIVTFPGEIFASRHSCTHLSTIGLPELIAHDKDEYVELAVDLAKDGKRLARLHAELRDRMANSPTCDGLEFATDFTKIMQTIWRDWCLTHPRNHREMTLLKSKG